MCVGLPKKLGLGGRPAVGRARIGSRTAEIGRARGPNAQQLTCHSRPKGDHSRLKLLWSRFWPVSLPVTAASPSSVASIIPIRPAQLVVPADTPTATSTSPKLGTPDHSQPTPRSSTSYLQHHSTSIHTNMSVPSPAPAVTSSVPFPSRPPLEAPALAQSPTQPPLPSRSPAPSPQLNPHYQTASGQAFSRSAAKRNSVSKLAESDTIRAQPRQALTPCAGLGSATHRWAGRDSCVHVTPHVTPD